MAEILSRLARFAARPRLGLLLAFGFGLIAALGQAPVGLAPFTLAGLFGGYAMLRGAPGPGRSALIGWALGAGYFGLTLIWIVQPFLVDAPRYGWMAPFALFGLAGGLALFWAAGSALGRWLAPGRRGWLGWPAAMSAAELLRGAVFTGFPWGEPGLAWVGTPVMQLGAWVGASGLTFLTFLLAAASYAALRGPRRGVQAAAVLAVFLVAAGIGVLRANTGVPVPEPVKMLRLVQPNAAQHLKWDPDYAPLFLQRQLDLTAAPPDPGSPPPDLVIWPETAVPYLLDRAPQVLAEIAETAAPAPVILGIQRAEGRRYFNSLVALDRGGEVAALYDKRHLVPFGEYTPGGDLLNRWGVRGFAAQQGYGYSPGPGAVVLDLDGLGTGLGKVLPLICYEAIFARDLRAAPERADWIVQLTNDAWFGTFSGPQQHLAQARMRAVEMGLPLVRAANTGISAVIDARGRITASLPLNTAGRLDAPLPGPLPPTPYARAGDAPLGLLLILVFAGLILQRRGKPD